MLTTVENVQLYSSLWLSLEACKLSVDLCADTHTHTGDRIWSVIAAGNMQLNCEDKCARKKWLLSGGLCFARLAAFTRPQSDRDNVTQARLVVSELIAEKLKPPPEGDFVKEHRVASVGAACTGQSQIVPIAVFGSHAPCCGECNWKVHFLSTNACCDMSISWWSCETASDIWRSHFNAEPAGVLTTYNMKIGPQSNNDLEATVGSATSVCSASINSMYVLRIFQFWRDIAVKFESLFVTTTELFSQPTLAKTPLGANL